MKIIATLHRIPLRGALLTGLVSLSLCPALFQRMAGSQAPQPYVLGPTEGEHLIRNAGSIFIKVDPARGANSMALGTQQVPLRAGIRVHQHAGADEALFVLEGAGFGLLGDTRVPLVKGSAMFVPRGAWHGVENPDVELQLLWVVAPPGLEAFFREVASVPGAPPKSLTAEQLSDIGRKHGIQFK
jgi:mannose-6-phosphate isomerase-like protein (cupin superfamily)